jgi:hypothetical protein
MRIARCTRRAKYPRLTNAQQNAEPIMRHVACADVEMQHEKESAYAEVELETADQEAR